MIALLMLPSLLLLLVGCLPAGRGRRADGTVRWVTHLATAQLSLAVLGAVGLLCFGWESTASLGAVTGTAGWGSDLCIALQPLTVTMLLLVSFVGWTIARFSARYLNGDHQQARYFRWVSVTVGAVCLMSVSGSLLVFGIAWVLGSLGIHHLLLHFPDRIGARQAAWSKFVFSRVGDLCMLIAVGLAWSSIGSSRFDVLLSENALRGGYPIAWMVVLAACLKSAQFPFHTWLPQTVETPTPVSALMHAGIVNAGGYLLVRLGPFLADYPFTLLTLTLVGACTAVVAGVVMMTQSSVKRSLAYSTVAQMGFMILQCGLGAFSAAFLHILAHSLYKAHAFLSSGSVITEAAGMAFSPAADDSRRSAEDGKFRQQSTVWRFALSAVCVLGILTACWWLMGIHPWEKPGGWVVAGVMALAMVSGMWQALRLRQSNAMGLALLAVTGLSLIYLGSYWVVDRLVPPAQTTFTFTSGLALAVVLTMFTALFVMHQWWMVTASTGKQRPWQTAAYALALNGFYVEAFWRRCLRLDRLRETS